MTQKNTLISFIALTALLVFLAIWWDNSNSHAEGDFITLGNVTFHTSLDQGIKEAVNQSKPIFVYFRSETCYWCIVFEKEALSDNRIVEILNNDFILISIDTFEQKNVAANLNVKTTPYMIFFTKNGDEISRVPGYIPKDEFLVKLNEIL